MEGQLETANGDLPVDPAGDGVRRAGHWIFCLCKRPEGSRRLQRHAILSHSVDQLHWQLFMGGKSREGRLGVFVIRYDADVS